MPEHSEGPIEGHGSLLGSLVSEGYGVYLL